MGVKEECIEVVQSVFGPSSARKVSAFSDDPINCVEQTKKFLAMMIGGKAAEEKMADLIVKYSK